MYLFAILYKCMQNNEKIAREFVSVFTSSSGNTIKCEVLPLSL